jgi:hypothetical protein
MKRNRIRDFSNDLGSLHPNCRHTGGPCLARVVDFVFWEGCPDCGNARGLRTSVYLHAVHDRSLQRRIQRRGIGRSNSLSAVFYLDRTGIVYCWIFHFCFTSDKMALSDYVPLCHHHSVRMWAVFGPWGLVASVVGLTLLESGRASGRRRGR